MNVKEIRRLNLLGLCNKFGRTIVASKCGYDDVNYLNQLTNQNVARTQIGDKTAARIEEAFEKPAGWMDAPHPEIWVSDAEANIPDMTNSQIADPYGEASDSIQVAVRVLLGVKEQ